MEKRRIYIDSDDDDGINWHDNRSLIVGLAVVIPIVFVVIVIILYTVMRRRRMRRNMANLPKGSDGYNMAYGNSYTPRPVELQSQGQHQNAFTTYRPADEAVTQPAPIYAQDVDKSQPPPYQPSSTAGTGSNNV